MRWAGRICGWQTVISSINNGSSSSARCGEMGLPSIWLKFKGINLPWYILSDRSEGRGNTLENVADNINEIVQYLKSSLFGLLNPILEDEEAFLKPADIMNFREFRIELLYLIAIYQPQVKIVTLLLSCNSCETLAGLFPEIEDLIISDSLTSVEEKIKIFYQKFYDMDIRDL